MRSARPVTFTICATLVGLACAVGRLTSPYSPEPEPAAARSQRARQWARPDGAVVYGQTYAHPDSYPRYAQLLVDSNEHLWVKAYPLALEPLSAPQLAFSYVGYVAEGGASWGQ